MPVHPVALPTPLEEIPRGELERCRNRLPKKLRPSLDRLLERLGGDVVARLPGATQLGGSLHWDFDRQAVCDDGRRIGLLLVEGDLLLEGDLVNREGDFGPGLLVMGDLHLRHLVHGGADWLVAGDVRASGLVVGHYNHGSLLVGGAIHAAALFADDHHLEALGGIDRRTREDDEAISALVGEVLDCSDGYLRVDTDAVIARILDGQAVLRVPGAMPSVIDAVQAGDATLLEAARAGGGDADAVGAGGMTALMIAAGRGRLDLVERLLGAGAQATATDADHRTALHHAAEEGKESVLQALLDAGGELEAMDASDRTPLCCAVDANQGETARLLLAVGADPNAHGQGPSLLLRALSAARRGHGPIDEALVIALTAAGADLREVDREGVTPVLAAAADATPVVLRALEAAGADFAARARFHGHALGALHFAALKANAANLAYLLDEHPVAFDGHAEQGNLALALAMGGNEAFELATGNRPDGFRWFDPARGDEARFQATRCLLERGLPANAVVAGIPLVHLSPDCRTLRLFLQAGAEVDACDPAGHSTLQRVVLDAPSGADVELARMLLAYGADPCLALPGSGAPLQELVAAGGDLDLLGAILEALADRGQGAPESDARLLEIARSARERNRMMLLLQHILHGAAQSGAMSRSEIVGERPALSFEADSIERDTATLQATITRLVERLTPAGLGFEDAQRSATSEREQDQARLASMLAQLAIRRSRSPGD